MCQTANVIGDYGKIHRKDIKKGEKKKIFVIILKICFPILRFWDSAVISSSAACLTHNGTMLLRCKRLPHHSVETST